MIVIACVDLNNGMMFHNRRQSQDREVRSDILKILDGEKLWMNNYSFGQFQGLADNIVIDENFLQSADEGRYCFVEDMQLSSDTIEQLILYRWDKKYPADKFLDIDLNDWKLLCVSEFAGYSHNKITKEVYKKNEE